MLRPILLPPNNNTTIQNPSKMAMTAKDDSSGTATRTSPMSATATVHTSITPKKEQGEEEKKEEASTQQQSQEKPRKKKKSVMIKVPVQLEDFMALEDPHPYGVLPGGNQLFGGGDSASHNLASLSESLWQDILSYCDATALAQMIQISRYFYVAGHQPELWRDLVLRQSVTLTKPPSTTSCTSWKDLYVALFHNNNATTTHMMSPSKSHHHLPINMSGKVYSDFLYRNHLCRSFAIPTPWLEENGQVSNTSRSVPCVDYETMIPEHFFENFEQANTPVIIRGAATTTQAFKKWQHSKYLLETSNSTKNANSPTTFRATSGAAPLPANFTFDAYLHYCQSFDYWEESPLYLFDRNAFLDPQHPWSQDFFVEFYQRCPYWNVHDEKYGHDLLQHLGDKKRPDHTWIIVGPKRSGSVFHLDPNATHAWNVTIKGRKRWIFYPPGITPPGVHPSSDGDEVALPLSVGEWILQYWNDHADNAHKRPIHERPMECTAHPGDAIFVPHGWWHMVVNLDDDYNLAMTHNYVSPSNLGNVLKFFRDKQDQISGCRDRQESIKPVHLHDKFVRALQHKAPQFVEKALLQEKWTCRAFEPAAEAQTTKRRTKGDQTTNRTKKRKMGMGSADDQNNDIVAQESKNSVMAKAKNESTPFSFSFL